MWSAGAYAWTSDIPECLKLLILPHKFSKYVLVQGPASGVSNFLLDQLQTFYGVVGG